MACSDRVAAYDLARRFFELLLHEELRRRSRDSSAASAPGRWPRGAWLNHLVLRRGLAQALRQLHYACASSHQRGIAANAATLAVTSHLRSAGGKAGAALVGVAPPACNRWTLDSYDRLREKFVAPRRGLRPMSSARSRQSGRLRPRWATLVGRLSRQPACRPRHSETSGRAGRIPRSALRL